MEIESKNFNNTLQVNIEIYYLLLNRNSQFTNISKNLVSDVFVKFDYKERLIFSIPLTTVDLLSLVCRYLPMRPLVIRYGFSTFINICSNKGINKNKYYKQRHKQIFVYEKLVIKTT